MAINNVVNQHVKPRNPNGLHKFHAMAKATPEETTCKLATEISKRRGLMFPMFRNCLFIVLLIIAGCSGNKKTEPAHDLQLFGYKKISADLPLTDYVKDLKYIQLETNEDCLLDHIRKVKISDNQIFVLDYKNQIYHFSSDGNFVTAIGQSGKGPGELLNTFDFCLIPEKKQIAVLNKMDNISIFSFSGEFIKTIKLKSFATSLLWIGNDKFAAYIPKIFSRDTTCILISDYHGKPIKSIKYSNINPAERKSPYLDVESYFYYEDGQIIYAEGGTSEHLFMLDANLEKKDFLFFNLKDKKMPPDLMSNPEEYRKRRSQFIELFGFMQVKNNFFFSFNHKKCMNRAVYNIKTGNLTVLEGCDKGFVNSKKSIVNNLWPVGKTAHDQLIFVIYPDKLLTENKISNLSFEMLKRKPELNDNPIIIVGK